MNSLPDHPIFGRFQKFSERLLEAKSAGHYFYMRAVESSASAHAIVRGQSMLMFSSNNYLGMAHHPRVKDVVQRAVAAYGNGACSARLMGGNFRLHEELETALASWEGKEAAAIYSSGYISNVATLTTLLSRNDMALIDKHVHASLIDGLRFAQIPFRVFAHNNMADLEQKLSATKVPGHTAIIVDSVYSMEGDLAPLNEIHRLARQHNALWILDEAHGTGVMGKTGRGAAEHFGLHGQPDIVLGTLSKALGGVGGFVAGPKLLIDYLKHNARGFVFSAALPPAVCAGILEALKIIDDEPEWLVRLHKNANLLRQGLQDQGWDTCHSESPIIPVLIGDDKQTFEVARDLYQKNIYSSPIVYPGVKKGTARIRLSVMATHTSDDIMKVLDAFETIKRDFGILELKPT